MKIFEITEANTKVKDKADLDWDTMFDEPVSKGELSTAAGSSKVSGKSQNPTPKLKVGSAADTRSKTAKITPTDAMRDMMSRINVPIDDIGSDEPTQDVVPHEPITPENLPAVITKEISITDPNTVTPTWHTVANLPGNMSRGILTLGKALFSSFTKTPTKDIVMIGNVGGQGPNSTREIRSVSKWVVDNGRAVDDASIDFDQTIPGYEAQTKHYTAGGVRFMLVKDQFGEYIYAWPEADSHGGVQQISSPPANKAPHKSISDR